MYFMALIDSFFEDMSMATSPFSIKIQIYKITIHSCSRIHHLIVSSKTYPYTDCKEIKTYKYITALKT